jgi:hypothetical protein
MALPYAAKDYSGWVLRLSLRGHLLCAGCGALVFSEPIPDQLS